MVEVAAGLGVSGWVRNRRDGSVEALVQGEPTAVDALIAWCRRGPPAARVSAVDVHETPPESHAGFDLRPTA
jgi:acylphosphatase